MLMVNQLVGFGASGESLPLTSYANTGGTGNRTGTITVTTNISFDSGTIGNLVDGTKNDSTEMDEPGLTGQAITAGSYIRFDFGVSAAKYIDEAKCYMSNGDGVANRGTWKWQRSDDAASWTDASAGFLWTTGTGVASPLTMSLAANTGLGRYYQLIYDTGGAWRNGFIIEFEFKIGP